MNIKTGDYVRCVTSGVVGVIIKQYYPTASAQQTMIRCNDGKLYHAPTAEFIIYETQKNGRKEDEH